MIKQLPILIHEKKYFSEKLASLVEPKLTDIALSAKNLISSYPDLEREVRDITDYICQEKKVEYNLEKEILPAIRIYQYEGEKDGYAKV
jgi:hypothetical protein